MELFERYSTYSFEVNKNSRELVLFQAPKRDWNIRPSYRGVLCESRIFNSAACAPKSPATAIAEVADTLLAYVAINNEQKQLF